MMALLCCASTGQGGWKRLVVPRVADAPEGARPIKPHGRKDITAFKHEFSSNRTNLSHSHNLDKRAMEYGRISLSLLAKTLHRLHRAHQLRTNTNQHETDHFTSSLTSRRTQHEQHTSQKHEPEEGTVVGAPPPLTRDAGVATTSRVSTSSSQLEHEVWKILLSRGT